MSYDGAVLRVYADGKQVADRGEPGAPAGPHTPGDRAAQESVQLF